MLSMSTTTLGTTPGDDFMSSFRIVTTASLLGLVATLAGCSAESATSSGAETASTARASDTVAAAPATAEPRAVGGPARGPHPGGPDFLLMAALHEPINLTADQKTAIEGALEANKPAGPPAFDKARVSALAAGIRAGKVDVTTLKASAPSDDAKAARQAAHAKALATLHATLTPAQRRALVDAVAKHAADRPDHADHGGRPPMDHAGGPPPGDMGPMGGMLEGLDLTKAQQDSIRAKLDAQRPAPPSEADRAAMKQQHEAFRTALTAKLQTFANDTFDANAFVSPPAGAQKGPGPGGDHADRFAQDLATITSVLDPAQREKLAARIEAGPPARGLSGRSAPPPATR
jgi:Spy/CpxP family protein refolding chaperone